MAHCYFHNRPAAAESYAAGAPLPSTGRRAGPGARRVPLTAAPAVREAGRSAAGAPRSAGGRPAAERAGGEAPRPMRAPSRCCSMPGCNCDMARRAPLPQLRSAWVGVASSLPTPCRPPPPAPQRCFPYERKMDGMQAALSGLPSAGVYVLGAALAAALGGAGFVGAEAVAPGALQCCWQLQCAPGEGRQAGAASQLPRSRGRRVSVPSPPPTAACRRRRLRGPACLPTLARTRRHPGTPPQRACGRRPSTARRRRAPRWARS